MTDIRGIATPNAPSGRENLATFSAWTNFPLTLNFALNAKHSLPLIPSSPPDNLQHLLKRANHDMASFVEPCGI